MAHCEVYCTAACCEKGAFEIHPALLLRKKIDENVSGKDGDGLLRKAWEQLKVIREKINSKEYEVEKNPIPIWHKLDKDLPDFWLETEGVEKWFEDWNQAFDEAINGVLAE